MSDHCAFVGPRAIEETRCEGQRGAKAAIVEIRRHVERLQRPYQPAEIRRRAARLRRRR